MIVFELICSGQHRFEGWFASGDDFERQRREGLLSCPVCSTGQVVKLPTAKVGRAGEEVPPGARGGDTQAGSEAPTRAQVAAAVGAFIDHVLQNTEDVGRQFPAEARRIHREEAPRRGIRGTATPEETEALAEEGIAVIALPIPPREGYH